MQIIDDGKHLLVYSEPLKSSNKLNAKKNYEVHFEGGPNGVGWHLTRSEPFSKPEFKIYGNQISTVDDVLDSFSKSKKSVGVILSGDKGTGKTVFSKLLSYKAHSMGMPTVLVNDNSNPGVANFISRIDTSSVVMFDEFEKKFQDTMQGVNQDTQNDLLSLFDGVLGGKNLYVITVNDIINLSPYILNRPGRFMYSIRMNQPTPEDIQAYLTDKLMGSLESKQEEIDLITRFSFKVPLSYDILDTLVFQINNGHKFAEVLPSLNLMNFGDMDYSLTVVFSSGYEYHVPSTDIDLFAEDVKVNTDDINFDFRSKDFEVTDKFLQVSGDKINRVHVDDMLKEHVQSGMRVEDIDHIEIKPVRSDNFGFNL
jgi:hypothetical protein